MIEYFALCFFCVVSLALILKGETSSLEDLSMVTKFSVAVISIPLIPVVLFMILILKVIRND
jgi:hypothetical protein